MAFIESRLLDCVAYGTKVGPGWNTLRIPLRSGIVRRKALQSLPLYRYQVLYRNLLPEHHEPVIAAFNACMGGAYSFRMKDWSDFIAEDELLPVVGTGAPQEVQLIKSYTFGSQTIARPIKKPVSGTVIIEANGTPVTATVDYTTGKATFTATASAVLRWSGQFDVPVYFADDEFMHSLDDRNTDLGLFLTSDVTLLEDRDA